MLICVDEGLNSKWRERVLDHISAGFIEGREMMYALQGNWCLFSRWSTWKSNLLSSSPLGGGCKMHNNSSYHVGDLK